MNIIVSLIFVGYALERSLADFPMYNDRVIGLACDATSVNSGVERKSESCYRY